MGVHFTISDMHMRDIEQVSGLEKFKCKNYYNFYGLIQKNNPPLLISYLTLPNGKTEKGLRYWLNSRGIPVVFEKLNYDWFKVGMRKDLRSHIFLAGAVAQFIVGYFENKVNPSIMNVPVGFARLNPVFFDFPLDISKFKY